MDATQEPGAATTELDVLVVGAGFAGLYALHRFRGQGLSVLVVEAGDGVGGTWYWNRYPGARCDVESLDYCYSFSPELAQEWEWTERFPAQDEVLRYANHVADRFDLRRDIRLQTRVVAATFDEQAHRWSVSTGDGSRYSARFLVMATGCLSATKLPEVPGIDDFAGTWYHTSRWPHDGVDFTGQRVGIIGTGSTGVQSIPLIAEAAEHLYVFQRTANFSIPAQNRPLDPRDQLAMKARYAEYKAEARDTPAGIVLPVSTTSVFEVGDDERDRVFEERWARGGGGFLRSFVDVMTDEDANALARAFVANKIRSIVRDPAVAELLTPTDHPIGTKRICIDTRYYETYNRPNVTLVDVRRSPIVAITPTGLRTADAEYDLDCLVFATGFDAMTGALLDIDIRGRGGLPLREKWRDGPRSYLGLAVAGFPNMFTITGPGSPSVLANMIMAIEQHVDWIGACIDHLRDEGVDLIEASPEAEDDWTAHVGEVAQGTLYPRANSWYVGANVPGKPRVFLPYVGGLGNYRRYCEQVVADGYDGFALGARGPARHAHVTMALEGDHFLPGSDV